MSSCSFLDPMPGEESEIEIRQVYEVEDLGPLTPERQVRREVLRTAMDRHRA
jgi:hypothetical protein